MVPLRQNKYIERFSMKFYTLLIALAVFASWLTVHAAESDDNLKIIEKPQTIVYKDSSEHNRMNKKWMAQWQLFGIGPNGTAESALIAGYHLDRNSILQLEAGNGGVKGNSWFFNDSYELSGSTFGIHYKKFFGNSFYAKLGMDSRSVTYKYKYALTVNQEAFQGDSIAAGLVIGNQWQWENFNLGCDWIGYSVPFYSKISSETVAGSDPLYRDELNSAEQKYLKDGFVQGLRFYMGYSF